MSGITNLDFMLAKLGDTPMPEAEQEYSNYLAATDCLGHGFWYSELVRWTSRRHQHPPKEFWHRMVPTMAMANMLREWMVHGPVPAKGLRVAAAYRPKGGSRFSQHKRNAALDLDLMRGDYDLVNYYYREAVRLWCKFGKELKMGLGLYCRPGREGGIRVHIDTGFRCRSWQISGKSHRPYMRNGKRVPLAVELADNMGLQPPSEEVI